MNTVILQGNLGKKPEKREVRGTCVWNFHVADSYGRKDKKETIWWKCSLWGEHYDKLFEYLDKGSAIVVHGEMKPLSIFQKSDGSAGVMPEVNVHHVAFAPFQKKEEESSVSEDQDGEDLPF